MNTKPTSDSLLKPLTPALFPQRTPKWFENNYGPVKAPPEVPWQLQPVKSVAVNNDYSRKW